MIWSGIVNLLGGIGKNLREIGGNPF